MAYPVPGPSAPIEPWAQARRLQETTTAGAGGAPVGGAAEGKSETSVAQSDAGAANGSATDRQPDTSGAAVPPAPPAQLGSAEPNQVSAMPDRLRAMIIEFQTESGGLASLHAVSPQIAGARATTAEAPLAPEVTRWVRAAILADPRAALRAQAGYTPDSARAFLRMN
ncbi:MAG: hypothetical protein ACXWUX_02355 [Allosphingosinicella sp.]